MALNKLSWAHFFLAMLCLLALLGADAGAGSLDLQAVPYQPPFTEGHLLGTDRLGRDVARGLLAGARVAVLVGGGGLLVALSVGLPLGAVAGYFGNDSMRMRRRALLAITIGLVGGGGYAIACVLPLLHGLVVSVLALLTCIVLVSGLSWLLLHWPRAWMRRRVGVWADRLVLLLLEVVVSVPGLIVLISVLAYVRRPGVITVAVVIGLLSWTSITRFLRAELLRVRELPYIAAARVSGLSEWRVLIGHALPNAAGPVIVAASFLVGYAILAEATLSFLGIGLPAEQVSWGSLLRQAREQPEAWWLALFPGVLLTLTVLACQRVARR